MIYEIKNKMQWAFVAVAVIFISACDSTGDGTMVEVPRVDIRCTTAKCSGMPVGTDVVVNFTLSGCSGDQITFDEYASGGMRLTCGGGVCSGTITSWEPSAIPSRSYYVCGWIDIDDNSQRNSLDAFSEQQTYITGAPLELTDWGATYSNTRQRSQND